MNELQESRIKKITALHTEIGGYLKTTLSKAIEIGGLLSEQKAEMDHGQWLPWIKENLPFSERTARDYIQFHERREELKTASVADMSEARRLLTKPKTETQTPVEIARKKAQQAAIEYLNITMETEKAKQVINDNPEEIKVLRNHISTVGDLEGTVEWLGDVLDHSGDLLKALRVLFPE